MKKETVSYLLISDGRVSRHFQFYFKKLHIPYLVWSRKNKQISKSDLLKLHAKVALAKKILLLISDDSLEDFYNLYLKDQTTSPIIHFSGSKSIKGLIGAHPLMSFTKKTYPLNLYKKIPFVVEAPWKFKKLFPELPNPNFQISPKDKKIYHAFCVISGNFTVLLWQKAAAEFQKINLPGHILSPYQKQIFKNMDRDLNKALTGPIVRKDTKTIKENLLALKNNSYQDIYRAFLKAEGIQL